MGTSRTKKRVSISIESAGRARAIDGAKILAVMRGAKRIGTINVYSPTCYLAMPFKGRFTNPFKGKYYTSIIDAKKMFEKK